MCWKLVLGALKARSRASRSPTEATAGDAELQVVETELGVLEGEIFFARSAATSAMSVGRTFLRYGMPAKSRLASSAWARVWIVSCSAEVAAEGLVESHERRLELAGRLSTETTPASISKRRRLRAMDRGCRRRHGGRDWLVISQLAVPSSSAINESRGWSSSIARMTIGPTAEGVTHHAGQIEHHAQVADRGQGVALEPAHVATVRSSSLRVRLGKSPKG